MFGDNPIRKPLNNDGNLLEVKSVFPTLQGEGPFTGVPSVFIRLGGCNLACNFCDTEFEEYTPMALSELMQQVHEKSAVEGKRVRSLVVITGGEPLRQNIAPLCEALLADDYMVQIETNGTLYRALPPEVDIVCSPKNTGQGYFPIREDLLPYISAFKFIVSTHRADYKHVAEIGQTAHAIPVYVQPMDEYDDTKNAENVAYALKLASAQGYYLSLQTHKILGIE
ncbi:MAG: 7-carboxy-7-deazaguanine synthase QueE [Alphaproteobacteria bacterium]